MASLSRLRKALQLLISGLKNGLYGRSRAKGHKDTADRDANLSAELEQGAANGAALSISEFSVGEGLEAQGLHQNIGKGREPEPELIALKVMGRGAVAKTSRVDAP